MTVRRYVVSERCKEFRDFLREKCGCTRCSRRDFRTRCRYRMLHARTLPLRTDKSPFKQRVKDQATTTWVKPRLVAEVKFTEWTAAGEMRHPAFLGLRDDKKPKDVVLEKELHRKG